MSVKIGYIVLNGRLDAEPPRDQRFEICIAPDDSDEGIYATWSQPFKGEPLTSRELGHVNQALYHLVSGINSELAKLQKP